MVLVEGCDDKNVIDLKKNPYPSVITVKIRASRTAAHCHITVEEGCSVAVTTEFLYTVLYAIYFLSLLP